jgi:phospholipase C
MGKAMPDLIHRTAASLQPGGNEAACSAANQYVWQLTKAGFLTLPVPSNGELQDLTQQVARNNNYRDLDQPNSSEDVLNFLHNRIQHVIYIVKENRTYDQILGIWTRATEILQLSCTRVRSHRTNTRRQISL